MEYRNVDASYMDRLWELQMAYKAEIGEREPTEEDYHKLAAAIQAGQIGFYGAWDNELLVGCCSITVGFSTFDYAPSGVFEDFYIRPEYRHTGIARPLVQYAFRKSAVQTMTVGCADCDVPMYQALGFSVRLGSLFAYRLDFLNH